MTWVPEFYTPETRNKASSRLSNNHATKREQYKPSMSSKSLSKAPSLRHQQPHSSHTPIKRTVRKLIRRFCTLCLRPCRLYRHQRSGGLRDAVFEVLEPESQMQAVGGAGQRSEDVGDLVGDGPGCTNGIVGGCEVVDE